MSTSKNESPLEQQTIVFDDVKETTAKELSNNVPTQIYSKTNSDEEAARKKAIKRKRRIPRLVTGVFIAITTYLHLWAWVKILSLLASHYMGREMFILPFVFGKFDGVSIIMIPFVAAISVYGWLLSTRVVEWSGLKTKFFLFLNVVLTNAAFLMALGMSMVQNHVLPFFYKRLSRVIDTSNSVDQALFSQVDGFFFSLMTIPIIVIGFIGLFINTRYRQHELELKQAFETFKWSGERLRKFENLGKLEDVIVPYPDIELGINKKTNEMVVLPGFDRTLNTIITGSIGTGKTAALGLPIIKQDLDSISRFINMFHVLRKKDDYFSEDVQGRFMNGLSVIEPSNDLCQKVYKLAKAHDIPDEAITYIDPTNPNTVSINPMKGPTDKVSEVFTQVIGGLADNGGGGNFYFEQAQRNHLKHHIYLLKEHEPDKEVTFDMLIDMYNDTTLVHEMHMKLKKRFPEDFELIDKVKYRDEYNSWQILKGIDEWFDKVIVPKEERTNSGIQKVRNDDGEIMFIDALEMDVKGLRNILNDIGANILIRRVLFGPSTFDFDKHMGSAGGVLLVNTAKGQLEQLGSVLGKIVLMTLQNASFRREPNVSTFHHILIDEAPEYLYGSFASFPAQSRKFKVIITMLQQTLTQLRGAFGEDYMNTVVSTMRNRMVYADVSNFDGKYFSEMFGEKQVFQEGEQESQVSPLQEDPGSRSGSTYSKTKEAALTSSDILFQDAFECAVKIVVNNKSMAVQQIKANFVPKIEFEDAQTIKIDPVAAAEWIKARYDDTLVRLVEDTITEVEELDHSLPKNVENRVIANNVQEEQQVVQEEQNAANHAYLEHVLDVSIPSKAASSINEPPNYTPKNATVPVSVPKQKMNYDGQKSEKVVEKPKESKPTIDTMEVSVPSKPTKPSGKHLLLEGEIHLERANKSLLAQNQQIAEKESEQVSEPLDELEVVTIKKKVKTPPVAVKEEVNELQSIDISVKAAPITESTEPTVQTPVKKTKKLSDNIIEFYDNEAEEYAQSELDSGVTDFVKKLDEKIRK